MVKKKVNAKKAVVKKVAKKRECITANIALLTARRTPSRLTCYMCAEHLHGEYCPDCLVIVIKQWINKIKTMPVNLEEK